MIRPLPIMFFASVVVAAYGLTRPQSPIAQTAALSGRPYIIDGDTIAIGETHIRLFGIDAPETDQFCTDADGKPYRCGLLATAVLEEEIAGRAVDCTPMGTDRYGRTVAICDVAGRDLGDVMVRRGYAIDYERYDPEGRYAEAQIEAKEARRGMWAGAFMEPEAWRHRR